MLNDRTTRIPTGGCPPGYAYRQYQQTQTHTASPGQLVVMLYQGAIKFLVKARYEVEAGHVERAHNNLVRAQDIVLELMNGLDLSIGPVAENLHALYSFMYRRLVEANVRKDAKAIDDVLYMLRDLLPAWEQAVASVERAQAASPSDRASLARAST